MTDSIAYTRDANPAAAGGLRQIADIKVANTQVLRRLSAALVPLSVSMLPNSDDLAPALGTVVDDIFDMAVAFVESQYTFGVAALNQMGSYSVSS